MVGRRVVRGRLFLVRKVGGWSLRLNFVCLAMQAQSMLKGINTEFMSDKGCRDAVRPTHIWGRGTN